MKDRVDSNSSKMKMYVSIPISGYDYEKQKEKADYVKHQYIMNGYEVITPFDVVKSADTPYNEAMGMCIAALLDCDGILICSGWSSSMGCTAEYEIARIYRKAIIMV